MGKKREEKDLEKKKKKKGGTPCCAREGVRKGAWTAEEDKILVDFITHNGHGTWRNLPEFAGLLRCGKSCRLRWTNYLRPDIKRGPFSPEEEDKIVYLHGMLGNKWAAIASHLPGRTDNDVKNFWNSHLRKRFNKCKGSSSVDMKPDNPPVARHVNNPSPLNASSDTTQSKGDYFLHLWNSNVGESFRNVNESAEEHGGPASHSANSQTSSLTRAESGSRSTNLVEQKVEVFKCKKEAEEDLVSKSCEMEDSSDAMMKMLLDFSVGDNDMGFLEPATR